MTLKTFNVEQAVYQKFSAICKEQGMSMSKQVERFMQAMVEEEPIARKEYLEKLDRIRKGKFIRVDDFAKRYGL
ncbi:hypothetical protein J4419_02445 [Candidatus Woesearchaeota archaeon]|nr:hypothetical protein [Candidatus Woesearchaeota archaeon]